MGQAGPAMACMPIHTHTPPSPTYRWHVLFCCWGLVEATGTSVEGTPSSSSSGVIFAAGYVSCLASSIMLVSAAAETAGVVGDLVACLPRLTCLGELTNATDTGTGRGAARCSCPPQGKDPVVLWMHVW